MNKQELFNLLVTIYIVMATIIFFVISYKIHCLNCKQNIIKEFLKAINDQIFGLRVNDIISKSEHLNNKK